jgi:hypothetical protein
MLKNKETNKQRNKQTNRKKKNPLEFKLTLQNIGASTQKHVCNK